MIIGSLGAGGKERQLIIHLKALQEQQKYSTILVVLNSNGEREVESAYYADNSIKIDRKWKFDLISPLRELTKVTKKYNVSLIHSWGSGIWDCISLLLAKWHHIPILHNGIQSAPANLDFSNRLSRFSALFADIIISNSIAGLRAFKLEDHPETKVIYNGMDINSVSQYTISRNRDHLCMVANFRSEKDHTTMIKALVNVSKAFPDVLLYLVGHNYGTLSEIERLVQELGLRDNVKFITDTLNPEPFIAQSEVCVLATHGEGVSNVLLEYMALKKPIVVSNNGGNSEVVINGLNGYLVTPKSVENLSSKIIELLSDKALAIKMGIEGRKICEVKFSIDKMETAFCKVYDELIN